MNTINIGTLVIDSTKLRANANNRHTKTKEQYEQWAGWYRSFLPVESFFFGSAIRI